MLTEFLMLTTTGGAAGMIYFGLKVKALAADLEFQKNKAARLGVANFSMEQSLARYRAEEERRAAHLRSISAKGHAAKAEKRAADEAGANERRQRTIDELKTTTLRSRAQVVAPVKAKRTKAKKQSGGEVAPTTGG